MTDDYMCPLCRHAMSSHPRSEDGRRYCRRAINELPSCTECAAAWQAIIDRPMTDGWHQ